MKIVFYTTNYKKGGLDTFLIHLLNNWPYNEDDLVLICNDTHPGLDTIKKSLYRSVNVLTVKTKTYKNKSNWLIKYPYKIHIFMSRIFFFFISIWKTRAILKNLQPSRFMVVNGGYPAADSCRAASIAWATINGNGSGWHNFHNYTMKSRFPYVAFENLIDFFVRKSVQGWITVSHGCAQSLHNRPLLKSTYTHVVPNGIEKLVPNFDVDIKRQLNIPESDSIILMLGVYEARKGHKFLMQVYKRVQSSIDNTQLIICGYGTKEEVLHVERLKDKIIPNAKVHLLGFNSNIADLFLQADVLVVPSQEFESFGLTSIEAMSMNVPVVATNIGGIPEVVKDGEGGYVFDRDDVFGFSECIIRLLRNEDLRIKQGLKGRQRFDRKYKATIMANQYAEIIRSHEKYI